MKVWKTILTIFTIMGLLVNGSMSVWAKNIDNTNKVKMEVVAEEPSLEARGTSAPSRIWDLSQGDYSSTFDFNAVIYSNNLFSGHDGTFYIAITSDVSGDTNSNTENYYMEFELCRKNIFGGEVVVNNTIETMEVGKTWVITISNVEADEEYYFKLIQPEAQRDTNIKGSFYVSKNKPE